MDNALVRFIGLAPKDVIELICNYLDFAEFLSLTAVSRHVRRVLVNHHLFWIKYYKRRVNYRQYGDQGPEEGGSASKYELRMPSLEPSLTLSDPASRLLSSARRVEIMKTDVALSTNPMLNLSILDNFKRSRWRGEFKQYTESLSRFSLPTTVVPTQGCNPFLVICNTSVCGFNDDRFVFNTFVTPLNEHRRFEIRVCCWLRLDDASYADRSGLSSLTSRVGEVPRVLVVAYKTDPTSLAVSLYSYGQDSGFSNVPAMTLRMRVDAQDEVSAMDVFGSLAPRERRELAFSSLRVFAGTSSGAVLHKRLEGDAVVEDRRERVSGFELTGLRFVPCRRSSVLVVFSQGSFLGVVDVGSWALVESVADAVTSFAVDAPNCLMAYATSFQNKATYVDLYNAQTEKAHYLVPKPPFCVLALERDSKWAIVIRNYIRVLQVIHPSKPAGLARPAGSRLYDQHSAEEAPPKFAPGEPEARQCGAVFTHVESALERMHLGAKERPEDAERLKFKSICTLNGHVHEITQCVHDGWSKLATVDASHNLFVWDYTVGCKIFSFTLLSSFADVHAPYLCEYEGKRRGNGLADSRSSLRSDSLDSSRNSVHRRNFDSHREDAAFRRDCDLKRSVKMINSMNSSVKDALEDLLYCDESDSCLSPQADQLEQSQRSGRSKNAVPASAIKGLLDPSKRGHRYHVDVSVHSLIVYYRSSNVVQVWSFK